MTNGANNLTSVLKDKDALAKSMPQEIKLDSLLAEGGQGIVYEGQVGNDAAAIKIYFPGRVLKRIQREVAALNSMDCPNIVKVLWSGEIEIKGHGQLQVVATAFSEGKSLRTILKSKALTQDELGTLAYDISNAISVMWGQRIVHRDLKPSNIVISPNGRACVIDLGVARYVDRSSLTPYGMSWGTYGYLSPEQTKAQRQLTCKSDIYSLGVTLIEASMGKHPTQRDQLVLLASGFHDNLPTSLENWKHAPLLKRMLHPRPTVRPMPAQILSQLKDFHPDKTSVKGT